MNGSMMSGNELLFSTDRIPIWDAQGHVVDAIALNRRIRPVPRRRCGVSEDGLYYKGAGIVYTGHYTNERDDRMSLVEETGVEYEKYHVIYPALFRRFGLFLFPHQPIFSDFEGGCGIKETNLLHMQSKFRYSAIEEIVDVMDTPIENHKVYVYRTRDLVGGYRDTLRLIEYLLCENYNTAWDKNIWDDIVCFGYVRDLADWFVSDRFEHKLGTIYGLLTSIRRKDKYLYELVVRELTGLEQLGDHHILFIAAKVTVRFAPAAVPDLDLSVPSAELYTDLWRLLYEGKACCHLEREEEWAHIRQTLYKRIPQEVALAMQDLIYHKIMVSRIGEASAEFETRE